MRGEMDFHSGVWQVVGRTVLMLIARQWWAGHSQACRHGCSDSAVGQQWGRDKRRTWSRPYEHEHDA